MGPSSNFLRTVGLTSTWLQGQSHRIPNQTKASPTDYDSDWDCVVQRAWQQCHVHKRAQQQGGCNLHCTYYQTTKPPVSNGRQRYHFIDMLINWSTYKFSLFTTCSKSEGETLTVELIVIKHKLLYNTIIGHANNMARVISLLLSDEITDITSSTYFM